MQDIQLKEPIDNYQDYLTLYELSIKQPRLFWDKCAQEYLDWFAKYTEVYTGTIDQIDKDTHNTEKNQWFKDGKLNACYNCLDRHLKDNADKIAYHWHGDEIGHQESITYKKLYEKVCVFSNVLLNLEVKKGDKVCIYLPSSLEAIIAILACARIGAVHTVVFAGFFAQALSERITDAECTLVISTDIAMRGGKIIPISQYCSKAVELASKTTNNKLLAVLLVSNFYSNEAEKINKDFSDIDLPVYDYESLLFNVSSYSPPAWMDAEDPLFILYTSGSTGKPKGVLHTTAGYLLHTTYSFNLIFDIKPLDIYWCTADIGWVAGHSYVIYGPLSNAVTSVIFSGTPNYPDYDIFWQLIDIYKVSIFYTAPTALRSLMQVGNQYLKTSIRDSLRLLGSVGEPINPECWQWYYDYVGKKNCPIIDTWWQTETGAAMLAPYRCIGNYYNKPGCAMLPFMGIEFALLDSNGKELDMTSEQALLQGNLVIKKPWPGMLRTVYKNHDKFIATYLMPYHNYFYTGDLAKVDKDGHYWLLGRSDDVINIAGHRLGTAEIESALISHESVVEAAAIGIDDDIKGQALYTYVVLSNKYAKFNTESIVKDLKSHVREEIGPIAIIKVIDIVPGLPKTRSGKIMRRILRKIADYKVSKNKLSEDIKLELGDISTLTNPEIIQELIS